MKINLPLRSGLLGCTPGGRASGGIVGAWILLFSEKILLYSLDALELTLDWATLELPPLPSNAAGIKGMQPPYPF